MEANERQKQLQLLEECKKQAHEYCNQNFIPDGWKSEKIILFKKPELIIDAGNFHYMSEFMTDLPDNVILNKILTGCGGTTVALRNDVPYVICSPFRSVIINKMKWAEENNINLCAVMGGIEDLQIQSFKGIKYMVTYDSLWRLEKFIDLKQYKILIDESHLLINQGAFRNDAVRMVLNNYKKFKSFVFMTATPILDRYQLPILKDIQKAKIQWRNIEKVNIDYKPDSGNLANDIAVIMGKHITGENSLNAHVFLNSVTDIIDIVETVNVPERWNHINIICAKSETNQKKINDILGQKYIIKDVGDVNKVNFYTSTAFEGCDIFDSNGKIYIVVDGAKDFTKYDIRTTIPQIIGRVRDIKDKQILLYFSHSQYHSGLTEEEYEERVKDMLAYSQGYVQDYNNASNPLIKEALYKSKEDDAYILQRGEGEGLIVNYEAWYSQMNSFNAIQCTYFAFNDSSNTGNFTKVLNETTYNYKLDTRTLIEGSDKLLIKKKPSFKILCQEYFNPDTSYEAKERILAYKPIISEAELKLGERKMKALEYRESNIRKELILVDKLKSVNSKITALLNYRTNDFISNTAIKNDLTNVFESLSIDKIPVATDIKDYFDVKESHRITINSTIRDFKKDEYGFIIITPLYK
jgi:hypothetical protein